VPSHARGEVTRPHDDGVVAGLLGRRDRPRVTD
jgi:hypothetical protein